MLAAAAGACCLRDVCWASRLAPLPPDRRKTPKPPQHARLRTTGGGHLLSEGALCASTCRRWPGTLWGGMRCFTLRPQHSFGRQTMNNPPHKALGEGAAQHLSWCALQDAAGTCCGLLHVCAIAPAAPITLLPSSGCSQGGVSEGLRTTAACVSTKRSSQPR